MHKRLNGKFRRGIDRLPDHRYHARDRAGEDNVPGLLRDKMRQDAAHAAEGGVGIEVQHAIPDVRVALGHRPADIGSGVGVENIKTPGELQNSLQKVINLIRPHQVNLQGEGVFAEFGDKFVELFPFAVDKHHFCASPEQGFRAFEADTGRRAGDSSNFTAEGSIHRGDRVVHFIILYRVWLALSSARASRSTLKTKTC